jgi:hypothetical protein
MEQPSRHLISVAIMVLLGAGPGVSCAAGSEEQEPSPPGWLLERRSDAPAEPWRQPRAPRARVVVGHRASPAPPAIDYVIVAADGLAASARRWKAYRERTGHRVALVLTGTLVPAGTPDPGREAALRQGIRRHLRARWQARDPTRPLYVLLLGDAPRPLPGWTYRGTAAPFVTDNPYADLDGDGIPDLALGRIPAHTDAEADGIRAKVERYESTYRVGPWNRRIHLFGAPGEYGAFVDALIEGVARELLEELSYDYDLEVLYGARGSPAAYPPRRFSDRVYELLNAGSLFTVYLGHGTEKGPQYGWWNGRSFDLWKTRQLPRRLRMCEKPPLLLLVACEMGTYSGLDGLGEKLLRHPQGPPAIIAATGVAHPYPNTLLMRALGHLVTQERVPTAGLALQRAKARMMRPTGTGNDVLAGIAALVSTPAYLDHLKQTHLRMYVLLGDPALKIRYVTGRAELRLVSSRVRAGEQVTVTARFDRPTTGVARFTLETRRKVILGRLQKLPADRDPRQARVLMDNHRVANDKVVSTRVVRFSGGLARVALPVPRRLPPGRYYVKVYAEDGHTDAMGSLAVRVR